MSHASEIKRLEALEAKFGKLWASLEADDLTPAMWQQLAEIRVRLLKKIEGHKGARKGPRKGRK